MSAAFKGQIISFILAQIVCFDRSLLYCRSFQNKLSQRDVHTYSKFRVPNYQKKPSQAQGKGPQLGQTRNLLEATVLTTAPLFPLALFFHEQIWVTSYITDIPRCRKYMSDLSEHILVIPKIYLSLQNPGHELRLFDNNPHILKSLSANSNDTSKQIKIWTALEQAWTQTQILNNEIKDKSSHTFCHSSLYFHLNTTLSKLLQSLSW